MRGLVAAAYAAVSFLTFVWADAAAGNSATYQINSAHTGFVEFRNGLVPPLTKIWARDLGGDYTSYPVVANGLVFVTEDNTKGFGKNHTTLFAIDIHTGKIVWKKNIPGDNYFSNVAYENGKSSSSTVMRCSGLSRPMQTAYSSGEQRFPSSNFPTPHPRQAGDRYL